MLFLGSVYCDFCVRHDDDEVQEPTFHEEVVYLLKTCLRTWPTARWANKRTESSKC